MKFITSLLLAVQALSVTAAPRRGQATTSAAAAVAAPSATATAGAGAGAGAAEGGEGEENEIEQAGQFGQVINLSGNNIKVDTIFPPGVSPSPDPTGGERVANLYPSDRPTASSKSNSRTSRVASCESPRTEPRRLLPPDLLPWNLCRIGLKSAVAPTV